MGAPSAGDAGAARTAADLRAYSVADLMWEKVEDDLERLDQAPIDEDDDD